MNNNCNKRAKDLKIEISIDDLKEIYSKQNGLCALSGIKMTHETYKDRTDTSEHILNRMNISIDRKDSNLGYTKDNIQLVGAIINRIKTDLPDNEFINLCKIVTEYNKSKTI